MAIKKKSDRGIMGFYIALCCCVLVMGAIGYFTSSIRSLDPAQGDIELETPIPIARAVPTIEALGEPQELPVFEDMIIPDAAIEDIPEPESIEDYIADNPDIEEASAETRASRGISMPVNGEILALYSDEPSYNAVLGDWRTHNGIDISAKEGSEVVCAADGEVKSCRETVYGTEVIVSHSDGYETIYTQITAADGIAEGRNLRQGDVIGNIAAPAGEEVTEPHLHFGVKKDGKYVDPSIALAEGNA